MPNSAVQAWILEIAKTINGQLSVGDIEAYARLLGNVDPKELLICLQNNGSCSTRNIIRLLYSTKELLELNGPDAVSPTKRKTIRSKYISTNVLSCKPLENLAKLSFCFEGFVESRYGSMDERSFNEAIHGVFRYTKLTFKSKTTENTQQTPAEVEKSAGQQRSIKDYCLKTSKLHNQEKKKKTLTVVPSDSDDSRF